MKYNIALIPTDNDVNSALISLAKEISIGNGLEPDYLLKNNGQLSIPHISVIQFEKDNENILDLLWQQVTETWQDTQAKTTREELACALPLAIDYKQSKEGSVTWSQIVINKNETPWIQQFHDQLREKLMPLGIQCLNAAGALYNPHFTLFNIRTELLEQAKLIRKIPESFFSILKSFSVKPALGIANDNWEFCHLLFCQPEPPFCHSKPSL